MTTLSEAYASPSVNTVILQTLEVYHQGFRNEQGINAPFYFVKSSCSLVPVQCRLEDDALFNGGELVTFEPAPMAIDVPENQGDLKITLGDISADVEQQLDNALDAGGQMKVIHRIYLLDRDTDEVSGLQNTPFTWSLINCTAQDGTLTATATIVDIINRPAPYKRYTAAFAPALTN